MEYHGFLGRQYGACRYRSGNLTCERGRGAKVHTDHEPQFDPEPTGKTHSFKGSGPGFECQHLYGSEKETRRQCNRQVDDPIHTVVEVPSVASGLLKLPIIERPEREQFWPGSADAVWQAHSKLVADLLVRKRGYGQAWVKQGYMGNLARVLSKADRLRNMLWRDETGSGDVPIGDESVIDTLLDLSALCALMVANLEEGNRWGHDR